MTQLNELQVEAPASDRRTARTRASLRAALAAEVLAAGDLSEVTATALADRAGITRRSFYTHYHDVDELVREVEGELTDGLLEAIGAVAESTLDDLHERIEHQQPAPGAAELLAYIQENGDAFRALLGPGGDAGFAARIEDMAVSAVVERASKGLPLGPTSAPIEYYVTSVVSAELGVIRRWIAGSMREGVHTMALALTMFAFLRPGDLYGKPIDFSIPAYGLALVQSNFKEHHDVLH